ncbi:hypothetical protein SE959_22640 [Escherichia coli]|nr:hypothetical protein [Escherichia coli]
MSNWQNAIWNWARCLSPSALTPPCSPAPLKRWQHGLAHRPRPLSPACINAGCAALIRPTLAPNRRPDKAFTPHPAKAVPNRGPDKAFVRIRHKPCRTLQKSH